MDAQQFKAVLDQMVDEFQREMDRAILERQIDKALLALGGKAACDRIARRLAYAGELPLEIPRSAVRAR